MAPCGVLGNRAISVAAIVVARTTMLVALREASSAKCSPALMEMNTATKTTQIILQKRKGKITIRGILEWIPVMMHTHKARKQVHFVFTSKRRSIHYMYVVNILTFLSQ